ncbi:biotin/lipoyl-containing protein, partial [Brevundimonas denitrificans]|uniref:biotin/lipoyl-containing protein n=1 Tax=Brevundimonas denitrificans TaxID=1443434 RepID=UPI0024E08B5F
MAEFLMPSLGADMEAGTLVEWLVKPGDAVKRGDIVAVVETQKGAIEIEIFDAGVVEQLLVQPGATVPVGTPLARLRAEGEVAPVRPPAPEPEPAATSAEPLPRPA